MWLPFAVSAVFLQGSGKHAFPGELAGTVLGWNSGSIADGDSRPHYSFFMSSILHSPGSSPPGDPLESN